MLLNQQAAFAQVIGSAQAGGTRAGDDHRTAARGAQSGPRRRRPAALDGFDDERFHGLATVASQEVRARTARILAARAWRSPSGDCRAYSQARTNSSGVPPR